jgi:glycerophosphoryl diester phosphodiesterase
MRDIEIIAHRGASHEAPENTLAAFRRAWELGADGIEGDFRLTADGEIVAMHDASTLRTTGVDLAVAETTLAELLRLDAGAWKGGKWRGESIPTLREVIATLPPGKRLFIELKSGPEILLPLAAVLAESGLAPDQVALLAFSEEVVAAGRELLPHIRSLWITDYHRDWHKGGWSPSLEQVMETLAMTGASGLASQAHRAVDQAFVRTLHAALMELHVWTVNSPRSAARYLDLAVDSITTNRPGWLRSKLQSDPVI